MFRLLLDAEGVPAFVAHEFHVGNAWHLGLALGGVKVQVPAGFFERACEIDTRCRAGEFRADIVGDPGDGDAVSCPNCGSTSFRKRKLVTQIVLAVLLLASSGIAIPLWAGRCRCNICGAEWRVG